MTEPVPPDFRSLYRHGFARVAACTGRSHPADPAANADEILALAARCHEAGAALAVYGMTAPGMAAAGKVLAGEFPPKGRLPVSLAPAAPEQ